CVHTEAYAHLFPEGSHFSPNFFLPLILRSHLHHRVLPAPRLKSQREHKTSRPNHHKGVNHTRAHRPSSTPPGITRSSGGRPNTSTRRPGGEGPPAQRAAGAGPQDLRGARDSRPQSRARGPGPAEARRRRRLRGASGPCREKEDAEDSTI
uniref:Uncharacterized protein n=1 Tax=Mustela putorius furo TaxID=9669 RepID=M3XPB8_MUSPF